MNKKIIFDRSLKDIAVAVGPTLILVVAALGLAYKFINPAPPKHLVIATGDDEGDYAFYAGEYKDIIKESGVTLELRPTTGARENLKLLRDPKSKVDAAFVQDGIDSSPPLVATVQTTANPNASRLPQAAATSTAATQQAATDPNATKINLVSLGSLYYEPMWIFTRGQTPITRFSQLKGKRVVVGEHGGGTPALAWRLLKASGIQKTDITILHFGYNEAADALLKGTADAAFFLATPDDPMVKKLFNEKSIRIMDVDQAEAITRHIPYLHHLVLPHGAIDLAQNIPEHDINLVAPTATLVARDSTHPALIYLMLKAASQVHSEPGIFEAKNEFPTDKVYDFELSSEAKQFYKSGAPFWQRYLPFWLATLVDRFLFAVLPLLAIILPMIKTIPKILDWRVRSRIYQRYGELKYLETQIKAEHNGKQFADHLKELDVIEERVNHMKVPVEFADHLYVLREHIHFVRERLRRTSQPQEKAV